MLMALPGDRWHPRLTPYRLCILTTTLGLGTAKAIATQQGSTVLPITLEWIAGVVLFIAFFVTGKYDLQTNDDTASHSYWSLIFRMDCMEFLWSLLSRFGYRRPIYSSEEREFVREDGEGPPVTVYRLMVSFIVLCFGMTKATLSYYGRSTSANWIDWALGAFISAIFYCVGLYENNTLNLCPWLFEDDHYIYFHPKIRAVILLIGIFPLSGFITMLILYILHIYPFDDKFRSPAETFLDKAKDFTAILMLLVMSLYGFFVIVLMIGAICSENYFSRRRRLPDRMSKPFRRARRWMLSRVGVVFFRLVSLWERIMAKNKILRFLFSYIFLTHAVWILVMGSIGITLIGESITTLDQHVFKKKNGEAIASHIVESVLTGGLGIGVLGVTLAGVWSLYRFFKLHMRSSGTIPIANHLKNVWRWES